MKKVVNIIPDFETLLVRLKPSSHHACLLSNDWDEKLAWNPVESFIVKNVRAFDEQKLHRFIARQKAKKRLIAGAVSYELGYLLHKIKKSKKDLSGQPLMTLYAYENYLVKVDGKVYVCFNDSKFLDEIKNLADPPKVPVKTKTLPLFEPAWDRKSYTRAFSKIKHHIYEGNIYQINLTQKLKATYLGNPRTLFELLSAKNTAKMKAYLESENFELLSLSPERFVKTRGRKIETTPIKGTRPRGRNELEDRQNERDLLADEKEKAELNMITDLLRNDLGKICTPGSVKVNKSREIERLISVIHTYSKVSGELKDEITPFQALLSMFPGGSITGCPKRRAIEIIDELESKNRGFYCGSMVVVEPDGSLDSSILIRTVVKTGNKLSYSVGSGIVNDSLEEKEYLENLDKAGPLLKN